MASILSVETQDQVLQLTINCGKANAFNHELISELHEAMKEAKTSSSVRSIVIAGKKDLFSAGFDLKIMKSGQKEMLDLVKAGGQWLKETFLYPKPIVMACTGHAIAMGALTLLTGDVRIGAQGDFKIGLNESSIGFPLPRYGVALANHRIPSSHLSRAVIIGELFSPEQAGKSGYLDQVVTEEKLISTALATAKTIGEQIHLEAFAENKLRVRKPVFDAIEDIWD